MTRILLVEDDDRLAALVAEFLGGHGYQVDRLAEGSGAASKILAHPPDLLILDVMLPGESGLSILRRIRADFRGPVLVLTARGDESDELLGFELGADDYVAKPLRPPLLLARVEALLRRGKAAPDGERLVDGDLIVDRARREVRVQGDVVDLTTSEFDLLWVLLSARGRPVSRDDLFRELRGIDYDGLDRSMDVRMSQLRKRLFTDRGLPSRIVTVRGAGYQFVPSEPG
jgi:two-component system response regulator RstA